MRLLPILAHRYRVYALTHSTEREGALRARGATPIAGDLDDAGSLRRLAGIAQDVIHMAPPPNEGCRDSRTTHLLRALAGGRSLPQRFVYLSTTGVYGDCGGDWVDESRRLHPQTDRARRRQDAERQIRAWGCATGVRTSILRVPGIYATDRLPVNRLISRTPVIAGDQDPFTNHVHADDLARIAWIALARGRPGRAYNASDDSCMRMGEYFDLVATRLGLPAPPRVEASEAFEKVPPMLLSFMRESRRIRNRRLREELRFRHRFPTVADGIPFATGTIASAANPAARGAPAARTGGPLRMGQP